MRNWILIIKYVTYLGAVIGNLFLVRNMQGSWAFLSPIHLKTIWVLLEKFDFIINSMKTEVSLWDWHVKIRTFISCTELCYYNILPPITEYECGIEVTSYGLELFLWFCHTSRKKIKKKNIHTYMGGKKLKWMEFVGYLFMFNSWGVLSSSPFRNGLCFCFCVKILFQGLSLSLLQCLQWLSENGKGLCKTNKQKIFSISLSSQIGLHKLSVGDDVSFPWI